MVERVDTGQPSHRDSPKRILLVEDDVGLARTLAAALIEAGYEPLLAFTTEDGERLARTEQPALALLDVMVPTSGGWELCRHIRAFSDMPILFLTALGDVDNVVRGLEMGADDYLVKPIEEKEFLARIKAHLRRVPEPETRRQLWFGGGDLRIDLDARSVEVRGQTVELTPREFDLLAELARHANKVLPTSVLLSRAWGIDDPNAAANVKPYIHYLRRKIEEDPASPRWLLTARGVGYRLADD